MKLRNHALLVAAILMVCMSVTACSSNHSEDKKIVTSMYPLQYVAQRIAGDNFAVSNITPLGAEPHDLELSPQQTYDVLDARLVIDIGNGFSPAIEKTVKSRDGSTLTITDIKNSDPHLWLDPIAYEGVVHDIAHRMTELDPHNRNTYKNREHKLIKELDALDEEYSRALSHCATRTIITSHDAFSRLAQRYGFVQESIAGFSPENEPSPQRLAALKKTVQEKNIDVIFTEELVSKKIAQSLSDEVGIKTEILSPVEGLTEKQQSQGKDYFDLMRENLVKLSSAMKCS